MTLGSIFAVTLAPVIFAVLVVGVPLLLIGGIIGGAWLFWETPALSKEPRPAERPSAELHRMFDFRPQQFKEPQQFVGSVSTPTAQRITGVIKRARGRSSSSPSSGGMWDRLKAVWTKPNL